MPAPFRSYRKLKLLLWTMFYNFWILFKLIKSLIVLVSSKLWQCWHIWLCCPPLSAMSSRSLRSFQQGLLLVPFARTSTKQIRAFSVVGPSNWNGLPSELRIFNSTTSPAFFLTLRLHCLTVLVLGALLSSFLEEALYKCSIWMNEWMWHESSPCKITTVWIF